MTLDLHHLASARLLVLGDLMVDRYLWGQVERISPEAPVPVVRGDREETRLGGAANVAHNLAALGCQVGVCGVVGEDGPGWLLREQLQRLPADCSGIITEAGRPTTEKLRILGGSQQMLRVDRESAQPVAGATLQALRAHLAAHLGQYGGVIVSDYGKGLVSAALLAEVVAQGRQRGVPVLVDPKGTDYAKYRGVTCLTPNEHEAALAARLPAQGDEEVLATAQALRVQLGCDSVCITRGAKGVLALAADGQHRFLPARAREVFDVTGAGDTFISVLGAALVAGEPFFAAVELANLAAGLVVGKLGTATVSLAELEAAQQQSAPPRKIFGPGPAERRELAEHVARLHAQGRRVVFTNGCFDLLHAGHIQYLQASRALGDVMIVGLNSDASVRRLKGPGRPVLEQADRAHVLAALGCVDGVAIFEEDTPLDLIRLVRPDVLTKGADYTEDTVVGHDLVQQWGGQVRLITLKEDRSTSGLIQKIVSGSRR